MLVPFDIIDSMFSTCEVKTAILLIKGKSMAKDECRKPLISFIVPVYNTAKYLPCCLDSIINQKCDISIEIVIIDDGSTDNSGFICEHYADKDDRIKVIHTENLGLSAARNKGISEARGEWIAFLDSDDWIEDDYVLVLSVAIKAYSSDLIAFGYYEEYENASIPRSICNNKAEVNAEDYITSKNYSNAVWNKIYRAKVFDSLSFPIGKNYEDIVIAFQILKRCNYKLLCVPDLLIHYRRRQSSIVTSYCLKDLIDCWDSNYERLIMFGDESEAFHCVSMKGCIMAAASIWCWLGKYKKEEIAPYTDTFKKISCFAKKNTRTVIADNNYGILYRALLLALRNNSRLRLSFMYIANILFRKIRKKTLYSR